MECINYKDFNKTPPKSSPKGRTSVAHQLREKFCTLPLGEGWGA